MVQTSYIFVVDTEDYAGNFERQLCAYVTGKIGECEVGSEEAKQFIKDMGLDEYYDEDNDHLFSFIEQKPDEHGCSRPCATWATPGWFNHGMGGHFRDGQEKEAKAHHKKECLEYMKKYKGAKLEADAPLSKFPAHLSVAIFMHRQPNDKEIKILLSRSKDYCKKNKIPFTGVRLLKEETRIEEVWSKK